MKLVRPSLEYLASYKAALEQAWSPDNTRPQAGFEQLEKANADPDAFVASLTDREATGSPVTLMDGSQVPRLPGYHLWMWDDEFCGCIGFRWQNGTSELPSYCLGHIGYSVVPWKQRRGYATEALRQILPLTKLEGLDHVLITTDLDNIPSQRVILANGGVSAGIFNKGPIYGDKDGLLFRITL
jgi:predicted acetyltransferase